MPKNFSGSVKTPRRNRIQEELEKGMEAAPQEEAQQETALDLAEDPAAEPTPAPAKEKAGGADDDETRLAEGRTQGKRGLYAKRINMAFLPEVYDYIRVAAGTDGKTLTTFVNESLLYLMKHDPEYLELRELQKRRKERREAHDNDEI